MSSLDSTPSEGDSSDFRGLLQEELIRRARANPRYSMRSFARTLGMDPSTLTKVLNGKRVLGPRAIRKLSLRLGLSAEQLQRFSPAGAQAEPGYQQLSLDVFRVISDWHHYALLELMRVDSFRSSSRWASRVLGISQVEVRSAIERLQRVGMVRVDAEGNWIDLSDGKSTTVGNDFTAAAFRNLQRQILQKALVALEEVPLNLRDQTSMTFAIDTQKLPEAKVRITAFRRELATFLSRGERRDQVYHLGISLYPVTKTEPATPKESP